MPAKGEKYFFISSLAKGIKVLELLAEHQSLTVSELARYLNSNRAAAHRFLATLRELGYVEKGDDDRYHLTFRVLEMGMKVAGRFEIHRIARPYMQELSIAFNETVNLGYFDGMDVLHMDKIDSREILRMDSPLGSRAPAYCTALGKAILAFLPSEELDEYLARVKLKACGPKTLKTRKQLVKALGDIRASQLSMDDEELTFGLRCVASPVFDHNGRCMYAISVSGPSVRMTEDRMTEMGPKVREICEKLSRRLGGTPFKKGD